MSNPEVKDFYPVDLPAPNRGGARSARYDAAAEWMNTHPGEWTPINSFAYGTIISAFRAGKYVAFPKGRYEFVSRKSAATSGEPSWIIYGRLPLPDNTPESTPEP